MSELSRPCDELVNLVGCYEALAELAACQDQRSPVLNLLEHLNGRFRAALDVLDGQGGLLS
jgi:hypothetical protein